VNRPTALLTLACCFLLTSCGATPGKDAARAACVAYGQETSGGGGVDPSDLLATAQERAESAAEADDTYAVLHHDLDDVLSREQALADAQNAGRPASGGDLDAYFAADEQVRSDCAAAGNDIGPLRP
jgi:hypothetical protein